MVLENYNKNFTISKLWNVLKEGNKMKGNGASWSAHRENSRNYSELGRQKNILQSLGSLRFHRFCGNVFMGPLLKLLRTSPENSARSPLNQFWEMRGPKV